MPKKGQGKWVGRYGDGELADRLNYLYWKQGLSLEKIAYIEGVTLATVHKRMKKLGIPRRGQHDWHRVKVDLKPSEQLAYILGVLLGDGMVSGRMIRLRSIDYAFAKSFYNALKKVGFRPYMTMEEQRGLGFKPLHVVRGASVDFVQWFKSLSTKDIERIVLKSESLAKEFIRGFYESEGYLNLERRGNPRAIMGNTNRDVVELVTKAINFIGFKAYIQGPYMTDGHKPIFHISTARPETLTFIQEISPCIKGGI